MQHDVDILLATWQGESFLAEQLQSLLNQEYTQWRLLVHDDGSTDATADILEAFASKYPERILIIRDNQRFGNACGNFAYLLGQATAPYVMFCDQDDIWLPFKVGVTREVLQAEERRVGDMPVLVHTDLVVADAAGREIAPSFIASQHLPVDHPTLLSAMTLNNVTGCTMMLNRAAVEVGLPIPPQAVMHDWWLACRTLQEGGVVRLLERPTIYYRQHASNAVGFRAISLRYYSQRMLSLGSVWFSLRAVVQQARALKAGYSTTAVVWAKLRHTLKRVIHGPC